MHSPERKFESAILKKAAEESAFKRTMRPREVGLIDTIKQEAEIGIKDKRAIVEILKEEYNSIPKRAELAKVEFVHKWFAQHKAEIRKAGLNPDIENLGQKIKVAEQFGALKELEKSREEIKDPDILEAKENIEKILSKKNKISVLAVDWNQKEVSPETTVLTLNLLNETGFSSDKASTFAIRMKLSENITGRNLEKEARGELGKEAVAEWEEKKEEKIKNVNKKFETEQEFDGQLTELRKKSSELDLDKTTEAELKKLEEKGGKELKKIQEEVDKLYSKLPTVEEVKKDDNWYTKLKKEAAKKERARIDKEIGDLEGKITEKEGQLREARRNKLDELKKSFEDKEADLRLKIVRREEEFNKKQGKEVAKLTVDIDKNRMKEIREMNNLKIVEDLQKRIESKISQIAKTPEEAEKIIDKMYEKVGEKVINRFRREELRKDIRSEMVLKKIEKEAEGEGKDPNELVDAIHEALVEGKLTESLKDKKNEKIISNLAKKELGIDLPPDFAEKTSLEMKRAYKLAMKDETGIELLKWFFGVTFPYMFVIGKENK